VDEREGLADEFAAAEPRDFQLAALLVHFENPDFPALNQKESAGRLIGLEEKRPLGKGRFAADPEDGLGHFGHRRSLL
jgi:hypothetical protein